MSNLLFVSSNRLGDAVLSTAVLRHFLDQDPSARVTVAAGPVALELFGAVPGLDQLIPMQKERHAAHWRKLWAQTVGTGWRKVIDMRGSALGYLLPAWSRIRLKAMNETEHRLDQYAGLLGLERLPDPKVWTGAAHRAVADRIIGDRPLLAVGPTANWQGKIWPDADFAELVTRLTAASGPLPGATVLVCGAPHERAQAAQTLAAIPDDRRIEAFGNLGLLELAACLAKADLYVGNDSGLMHMAAAAGAPTLGLFGPSREVVYAPRGPVTGWVRTPEAYDDLFGPDYDRHTTPSLMVTLSLETVEQAAQQVYDRGVAYRSEAGRG